MRKEGNRIRKRMLQRRSRQCPAGLLRLGSTPLPQTPLARSSSHQLATHRSPPQRGTAGTHARLRAADHCSEGYLGLEDNTAAAAAAGHLVLVLLLRAAADASRRALARLRGRLGTGARFLRRQLPELMDKLSRSAGCEGDVMRWGVGLAVERGALKRAAPH